MKLLAFLLPYIMALLLTLIIEGLLCWLLLKSKDWIKFTCLVNLLTNPLINLLNTLLHFTLANHDLINLTPLVLLALELGVWLSEAWLFYKFSNRQKPLSSIYNALLFSFILNATTYLTGLLLHL